MVVSSAKIIAAQHAASGTAVLRSDRPGALVLRQIGIAVLGHGLQIVGDVQDSRQVGRRWNLCDILRISGSDVVEVDGDILVTIWTADLVRNAQQVHDTAGQSFGLEAGFGCELDHRSARYAADRVKTAELRIRSP